MNDSGIIHMGLFHHNDILFPYLLVAIFDNDSYEPDNHRHCEIYFFAGKAINLDSGRTIAKEFTKLPILK